MEKKPRHLYEFGGFRLDATERQLRRGNELISLTPKAFDLLLVLVEQPGRLLEKETLLQAVWTGSFVEEHNLADTISRLRKVLGEGENGQKFIETVPKSGYRFLAPVNVLEEQPAELQPIPLIEPKNPEHERITTAMSGRFSRYQFGPIIVLSALVLAVISYFIWRPQPLPKVNAYTQITRDGLQKGSRGFASMVTDGARIYFSEQINEQRVIAQVSVNGGETVVLPANLPAAHVKDISPNRTELLIDSGVAVTFEAPLWKVPVLGGAPRRVGEVMSHAAAWTLDGQQIVYANGSDLWLAKSDGSESRKLATAKGRPLWLRWSPDGKQLVFTARTPSQPWKMYLVAAEGGTPQPLTPDARTEFDPNWSPDGKKIVFCDFEAKIIYLFDLATRQMSKLAEGMNGPRWSPDGRYLAASTAIEQGELMLYDMITQKWRSLDQPGASWSRWSRDGKYLYFASVTGADPELLRLRIDDGKTERLSSLKDFRRVIGARGPWVGWTLDDAPLALRDMGTQDIYALEVELP